MCTKDFTRCVRLDVLLTAAVAVTAGAFALGAQEGPGAPVAAPTYWQEVRPLLRKHCTYCHSTRLAASVDVSGGLALDSYDLVRQHGEKLLARVNHADPGLRMPKDAEPLAAGEIAVLHNWLRAGRPAGKAPAGATAATPVRKPARIVPQVVATGLVVPPGWRTTRDNARLEWRFSAPRLAPITALAFSPDGKLLAVGAYGQVILWNLERGEPIARLTDLLGAVQDLRFSPDGQWLAAAGGQPAARGDLRLFGTTDGKLLARLGGHLDTVAAVAFSPDGKLLASASYDKSVRIWELPSGKPRQTLLGHSDGVTAVAFTPDGQAVITGSKDRSLRRFQLATGKSDLTYSGANDEVLALTLRPEGDRLLAGSGDNNLIWWNAATGERVRVQFGHAGGVNALATSADGQTAASGGNDGQVRLWQAATGNAGPVLRPGTPIFALAWSPDGQRLAAGGLDGRVQVWLPRGNRLLVTVLAWEHAGAMHWLLATPEGWLRAAPEVRLTAAAGQDELPAEQLLPVVHQAERVVAALRGGPVAPVQLPAKPR